MFHGWWMVAAGSGIQFLQSCLLLQSFGAYVAVLQEDRGWSKTELSFAAALHQMEAAILGPLLGWFIDRFGPQGVVRIGVLTLGSGFMLLSQVESLAAFYGAFIVVALGSSLCGFFPLNVSLIYWFEKKRSRALSTLGFGLALGGIAVPLVAWFMATYGWRATAFGSGVVFIVLGFPLASVMRGRPALYGEAVDGETAPAPSSTSPAIAPRAGTRDFTAREALRTPAFWLLSLGHGFALFVVTAVNVHAISHLKEGLGYPVETAALYIMLMTLAQIGGIAIGATIGDRFDKRLICAGGMLLHMSGLLFLTYATNAAMVVAFALLHGTGWGLRGPIMHAIRADYFGVSAIGMILGLSFLIIVVGQIGGPLITGVLADATGNYRAGFTVIALLAGIGSLFFLLARKPSRPAA
ncbi:MAG: MFS transporter [Proteobacteria bacterium]|nr:MFS transporter [Pseudomonadota bacterium]